jgi:hypothetical protein
MSILTDKFRGKITRWKKHCFYLLLFMKGNRYDKISLTLIASKKIYYNSKE